MAKNISSNLTMEELLASQTKKLIRLFRGQQVEGIVVSINDKEIILDLGAKAEGVLAKRELTEEQAKDLKEGDKLKVFVNLVENESGQAVVSLQRQVQRHLEGEHVLRNRAHLRGGKPRSGKFVDWNRFIQAQNQKSRLQGVVVEVNKGGLIVEVWGVRGFLPNSQVGFELMTKAGEGMENLIGQILSLTVIEVDGTNNKLIFSQRGQISDDIKVQLKKFKSNQKTSGKIVAVLPFGLIVNVAGMEGLVFISDVAWEKIDDLSQMFKVGQEITVVVMGVDEELGRLNLSIKQLFDDPFIKLAEKYPPDEVVKGEVTNISEVGVSVKLEDSVAGLLPSSKIGSNIYEVGKVANFLVDSLDARERRVNLTPFVTSTEGLIYK